MKIDVFSIRLSLAIGQNATPKSIKWQTRLKFHMIFSSTKRIKEFTDTEH